MTEAVVIGVVTRTGSAVAVALSGPADTPRFRARREFGLTRPGLEAQPYHAAAGLDLATAAQLIGQVGRGAEEAAAAGLRSVADLLPASASTEVAVVVKAVSVPDLLPDVLRSHAWMHAAEGVLYRQAVLAAAQECGWTTRAVERSSLPAAAPALAVLGRAAGRPWRQIEKDAARAAIEVLAGTRARSARRLRGAVGRVGALGPEGPGCLVTRQPPAHRGAIGHGGQPPDGPEDPK